MTPHADSNGRWFPPPEFYTPELCSRCGVCCGSTDGRPCEHLRRADDGSHFCEIYETRLGLRRTVDEVYFLCVEIRKVIVQYGGYTDCAYVKEICRVRESMGQKTSDLGRMNKPSV